MSESLLMRPVTDDNFGCDGYSIITFVLSQVVMLVIAGTAGTLYHCIVLFDEDDEQQPTLHVAEKVSATLSKLHSTMEFFNFYSTTRQFTKCLRHCR